MTPKARWILIIVGLLVANALAMGFLVLASSTHHPKIAPEYERRAP